MARVYFWRDVIGDSSIFRPYALEIRALMSGDYASLSLEKLRTNSHPAIYSIRVNDVTRILFTTYEKKVCLLDVVLNHDYSKSRFLKNPGVLKAFLSKLGDAEIVSDVGVIHRDSFIKSNWDELGELSTEATTEEGLVPLDYYQQRLIRFSADQAHVLTAKLPAIVYGPAGSGKSCVALSLLTQYVRDHHGDEAAFPVAYISRSPQLVYEIKRLWLEMNPDGGYSDAVHFKTYDELFMEQKGVDAKQLVDVDYFYAWYKDYAKRKTTKSCSKGACGAGSATSHELTSKEIWQEFRIRSGYSTNEEYYALGARQTELDTEDRRHICAAYQAYADHLDSKALLSSALQVLTTTSPYQLMVVDEAQDLSYGQLHGLNTLSRGSILYLLGDHQVLFDGKSRLNYLRELFHHYRQKQTEIALRSTYRCSQKVCDVANALIQLKFKLTGGASDKLESSSIEVAAEQAVTGDALWLNVDDKAALSLLVEKAKHAQLAVVTFADYVDAAKKIFNTPLVFTPEQVKGLEYQTVVVWRPLDSVEASKASSKLHEDDLLSSHTTHRAKAGTGDTSYLSYFNELITAVTRARQDVVLVQDRRHQIRAMTEALEGVFSKTAVSVRDTHPINLSDWEAEAKRLLLTGNISHAHAIFIDKLGGDEAGFSVFSAPHIPTKHPSASGTVTSAVTVSDTKSSLFETEIATLKRLLSNPNDRKLKSGAEFKRLMEALSSDGPDGIENTLLFRLVKTPKNLALLCDVQKNHGTWFQKIPDSAWFSQAREGLEKNHTALYYLLTMAEGCEVMEELFNTNLKLIRLIPLGFWLQKGPHDDKTPLHYLVQHPKGFAILNHLLTKNPKLLSTIPVETWELVLTKKAVMNAHSSGEGKSVFQMLCKAHPLQLTMKLKAPMKKPAVKTTEVTLPRVDAKKIPQKETTQPMEHRPLKAMVNVDKKRKLNIVQQPIQDIGYPEVTITIRTGTGVVVVMSSDGYVIITNAAGSVMKITPEGELAPGIQTIGEEGVPFKYEIVPKLTGLKNSSGGWVLSSDMGATSTITEDGLVTVKTANGITLVVTPDGMVKKQLNDHADSSLAASAQAMNTSELSLFNRRNTPSSTRENPKKPGQVWG